MKKRKLQNKKNLKTTPLKMTETGLLRGGFSISKVFSHNDSSGLEPNKFPCGVNHYEYCSANLV